MQISTKSLAILTVAMWAVVIWIFDKKFDREFPPMAIFSAKTTEIRVVDKDISRLKVFVQMAENAKWQRYSAERVEILCELAPSGEWYRAQCKLGRDGIIFVDENLSDRSKVDEFLGSLYKDAVGAVPVIPVLKSKMIEV